MTVNYIGGGVYEVYAEVGLVLLNEKDINGLFKRFTDKHEAGIIVPTNEALELQVRDLESDLEVIEDKLEDASKTVEKVTKILDTLSDELSC